MQTLIKWARKTTKLSKSLVKGSNDKSLSTLTNGKHATQSFLGKDLPIIKRLPGFVYGPLRNIGSSFFRVDSYATTLQIELINENPEILNFNFLAFWVEDKQGQLIRYNGPVDCEMSSVAEVLPDPEACIRGDERNTVSVHSKREINPWWKATFPEPLKIAYVEFCNRKDDWGARSRGVVFSAFDINGKLIAKHSKVIKKDASKAFSEHGLFTLRSSLSYLNNQGYSALKDSIDNLFAKYLTSDIDSEAHREELLSLLSEADKAIRIDTPDMAGDKENGLKFSIPTGVKYFRVIAFSQKATRLLEMNIENNGNSSPLSASHTDELDTSIFDVKLKNWLLQGVHVFNYTLDSSQENNITIWHGGYYSSSAFVQRIIQTSEDGKSWLTIESTLENMLARLQLLEMMEWILSRKWTKTFTHQLGHFMSTYRISHARAVKALFKGQRDLMPVFFEGIDSGAQSAKYIPRVTYARHGLVVPLKEIDSEFLAIRMKRFCDFIKDNFALEAFPCYGTLLGIYRDGDFLPHDDDVDLAVIVDLPEGETYRSASEAWLSKFEQAGVKCRLPTPSSLNMHCYFEDFDMDLFFIYRIPKKTNKVWTHMEGYRTREVKQDLLEPLSTLDFKGVTFNAPKNVEGFLQDRYGPGWVKPDPTFEL
ncbi:LicD family protein [Alteromonas stellipolaris]|uniref:LicD family protein n=1 Tax=Alteromonas stellipolaris TaxID=233316 RepID=UPI001DA0CCDC|nr:LicD family protein [Alteromonas stellipolaris]MBZ2163628.1 LicD family protein [Alteromonas stellipolaris]